MTGSSPPLSLELRGVHHRYPSSDQSVLRGVDLKLEAGESLAVMGPSGAGKSTLLHLCGALEAATDGEVSVAGQALSGLDEDARATLRNRHIGFIFQAHHLLPQLTALENVLCPAIPANAVAASTPRAHELLARVGLGDKASRRPSQLSGGEAQRVAIARALINRPRLVLADEPTGSLDAPRAATLIELLIELTAGEQGALLLVTHAPALAARMNRRATLSEGRLSSEVAT